MNLSFRDMALSGRVIDVGGARKPDYFDYFDIRKVTSAEVIDGSISNIDFETDTFPCEEKTTDTVLLCNVLEHIYNHMFLLQEIKRVLKSGGTLVGFVPFLVNYHPDPHDYFRYTQEALTRMLSDAGFKEIHVIRVGKGPFYVNFNTIMLSFPRFLRPLIFIPYYFLDGLFVWLRPKSVVRYPLGYTFYATKPS